MKNSNCIRIPGRPVGVAGPATRPRPVCLACASFGHQHLYPWDMGRKHQWRRYTHFFELYSHILSVSSKQWTQFFSPLLCPDRQRSAGRSLIVTNNMTRRVKYSRLYSSQMSTPWDQSSLRSSTNGLRYTSMSLPGYFGPKMHINVIARLLWAWDQNGHYDIFPLVTQPRKRVVDW